MIFPTLTLNQFYRMAHVKFEQDLFPGMTKKCALDILSSHFFLCDTP